MVFGLDIASKTAIPPNQQPDPTPVFVVDWYLTRLRLA